MTGLGLAAHPTDGIRPPAGTLRLYGSGNVDDLDPATAHGPQARQLIRLLARQLLTYEPRSDLRDWQSITPVPDAAVAVPSTYNMGLGASHRCYVLHLRPGVHWDTSPPREVTAHDFVRGFKRLGNPVRRSPALIYFTGTIRGMTDFCSRYASAVPATPTPDELAAYQNANDISGIFALDDQTLVVELVRPAPDFVNVLAQSCASAAPVEYDSFVPGSRELNRNLRSNGPYRARRHEPGQELCLEPNPAWRPESDPVRRQHLEAIEVIPVPDGRDMSGETGALDLRWPMPQHASSSTAGPGGATLSYALDPYLLVNLAPAQTRLRDVRVRRALAAAVDKEALAQLVRRQRPELEVRVAGTIIPPGNEGHRSVHGTAAVGGSDPERARALLAEAGWVDTLTLTAVHRSADLEAAVARRCASDLETVGIRVRLVALADGEFDALLRDPARATAGDWDLASASWSADWVDRNGRVYVQPLLQSGAPGNYGQYASAQVDEQIDRALQAAAESPVLAERAWHEVEGLALDDLPIVPLLFRAPPVPLQIDPRIGHAVSIPALGYLPDLTTVRFER